MTAVASALQSAHNGVLWERMGELVDAEGQRVADGPIHLDPVGVPVEVGDRSVVPIIATFLGNEALQSSVT